MKCPHCLPGFHDKREIIDLGEDRYDRFRFIKRSCPECGRFIFSLYHVNTNSETLFYPKSISRSPLPAEVPHEFAEDYLEACTTISDNPKASAALSRRCLQYLLREKGNVKKGNFAAHPLKSTSSGKVIKVEPGEAEWNLDVLESLFDFYFVQPEILRKKREDLNKKLKDAGKPEMK